MNWIEATQENIPNKEGETFIVKTKRMFEWDVLKGILHIDKKTGFKSFSNIHNQVVTHILL